MSISKIKANRLWTAGNNAGNGFAPGGGDSVDEAVAYYERIGARIVRRQETTDDVAVIEEHPGTAAATMIGIGGDGTGNGAWAVRLDV